MAVLTPRRRGLLLLMLLAVLPLCASAPAGAQGVRGVAGRDREHVVVAGENLYGLAQQYGVAIEHLAFANGLDTGSVYVAAGTRLLVPGRRVLPANPPADGLVVNLPERGVFLFRGGRFEKFYPLAIGQPGRFQTPQGSFSIVSRVENPAWLPPEWAGLGEVTVQAGPDNPLGDRWIGLSAPGVGLHATTSPMSIGQAASHGCMRMYPASARELFEKVRVGMPVRIEYETVKAGYDESTGGFYLAAFPDVYGQGDPILGAPQAVEELGLRDLVDEEELRRMARPTGVARLLLTSDVSVAVRERKVQMSVPPIMRKGNLWVSTELARALGLAVSWDADLKAVEIRQGDRALLFPVGGADLVVQAPLPQEPARRPGPGPALPTGPVSSPAPVQATPQATTTPPTPEQPLGAPEPMPAGPVEDLSTPKVAPLRRAVGGAAFLLGGRALVPVRPILQTFALPHRWDPAGRTLHIDGHPAGPQ